MAQFCFWPWFKCIRDAGMIDPNEFLEWSAGLSEYQRSGANTLESDFEVFAQIDGVGAPAFVTPATLALPDFEGVSRAAESADVAPVYGSRVVTNLAEQSEDLSDAQWAETNASKTAGIMDPDEGTTAITVTATAALGKIVNVFSSSVPVSNTWLSSVWIKRRTGVGAVQILNGVNAAWVAVTITTAWKRYTITGVSDRAGTALGVRCSVSGDEIDVWHPQLEDSTGQTNQAPSHYIPTTTGPVTKHYANYNGNTVSANVVTEAVGNPLLVMPTLYAAPAGTWDGIVVDTAINLPYDILNHSDDSGMYYCEYTPLGTVGQDGVINLNSSVGRILYHDNFTRPQSYDGTTVMDIIDSFFAGQTYKLALAYSASEAARSLSKDAATKEGLYDGDFASTATTLQLLSNSNGLGLRTNYPSLIGNVRKYKSASYADDKAIRDALMEDTFGFDNGDAMTYQNGDVMIFN